MVGRRVERVLEQSPEDTETAIGGVDDGGAPVVHGDMNEIGIRLEGYLDLPQAVVRVGVVKGEADEARHDSVQPPRVLYGDSGGGRKCRQESQN